MYDKYFLELLALHKRIFHISTCRFSIFFHLSRNVHPSEGQRSLSATIYSLFSLSLSKFFYVRVRVNVNRCNWQKVMKTISSSGYLESMLDVCLMRQIFHKILQHSAEISTTSAKYRKYTNLLIIPVSIDYH